MNSEHKRSTKKRSRERKKEEESCEEEDVWDEQVKATMKSGEPKPSCLRLIPQTELLPSSPSCVCLPDKGHYQGVFRVSLETAGSAHMCTTQHFITTALT